MLSEAIKERLGDPDYLDLHLAAVASIGKIGAVPWYDAHFLRRFEAAKHYLGLVRPDALSQFVDGFAELRPPEGFSVQTIDDVFDAETYEKIRQVAHSVPEELLELHEVEEFGRNVVHDHPYFLKLQEEILSTANALAGRELVPGYNFLSLYGGAGQCEPHMDEPISMYTLDFCIDQNVEWPIHFSQSVDWPSLDTMRRWDPEMLAADPALRFEAHILRPNQALFFNGSSQWHYRDAIPDGGYCNLLFFHYYPAGCANLVKPAQWADHFPIPELRPLCDLFGQDSSDGLA